MEWRFANGRIERFGDLATEIIAAKADVIVVWTTDAALEQASRGFIRS